MASQTTTTTTLNNGTEIPLLGFGTYKVGVVPASASAGGPVGRSAKEVIKDAIDSGYRLFDCAQFYGNEKEVGEAFKEVNMKREDLYIVSKVWCNTIYDGPEAVCAQVEQCLKDLQMDYVDLFLVHWPVPGKHVAAYKALESMLEKGKVKAIGVSNYTVEDLEELRPHMKVPPAINQIEINPFLYRKKTIDHFQKNGCVLMAYRTLRQGKEMSNPVLVEIAAKHKKTPAQVLGRWCTQKNIIFIPKSEKKSRMEENSDVFSFDLDEEDFAKLDAMTTEENLEVFKGLYEKCIIRDTPLTTGVVAKKITLE